MSDIEKINALLKEIAAYFKAEAPLSKNQIYAKLVRMSNTNPNSIEYLRDEFLIVSLPFSDIVIESTLLSPLILMTLLL